MPNPPPSPALSASRRPTAGRSTTHRSTTGRSTARRRGVVIGVALLGLVGAGAYGASTVLSSAGSQTCTTTAAGASESFDPEQTANAALITAVAMKRGLPSRAATIALTTAYQESKILNLRYGDRDSLGLFQQRPSQGWGTEAQILDPVYATNSFYDALVKVAGYENADITEIAQKVQRSGFPEAYRDHEGQGRALASTLTGNSPARLTCRLDAAAQHASAATVKADLAQQMGLTTSRVGDGALTITAPDQRRAWAAGHWAVARAQAYGATRVSVGARTWDRARGEDGWSAGAPSTTVTITLR